MLTELDHDETGPSICEVGPRRQLVRRVLQQQRHHLAQLGTSQEIVKASAVTTGLAVTSINTTKTCTATFANVNVTTTIATGLFTNNSDIGSPNAAGSASFSNGIYTVAGAGVDIWNTSDQFQYDYKNATGDVTISAQVTSVQNIHPWSKAGVMIRDGIAANAAFADVVLTPGGYLAFQWRASAGGICSQSLVAMKTAPQYVKLVRAGNSFTAYYSSDGTAWTQVGTAQTIMMAPAVTTGLAVTSINTSKTCTAAFANVSLS